MCVTLNEVHVIGTWTIQCTAPIWLKMLGLYRYTLIFSHKSCNVLSIEESVNLLNKLPVKLQTESQILRQLRGFGQKVKQQQQQSKKSGVCLTA